jgi:hypothetical protein
MHHGTTLRWKKDDADFARQIDQAESKFILTMTETVAEAAKSDWRAGVELLARRFPKEYAKPETQTAITQVNFNAVPPRERLEQMAKNPHFVDALGKRQERIRRQQERDRAERAETLPG